MIRAVAVRMPKSVPCFLMKRFRLTFFSRFFFAIFLFLSNFCCEIVFLCRTGAFTALTKPSVCAGVASRPSSRARASIGKSPYSFCGKKSRASISLERFSSIPFIALEIGSKRLSILSSSRSSFFCAVNGNTPVMPRYERTAAD